LTIAVRSGEDPPQWVHQGTPAWCRLAEHQTESLVRISRSHSPRAQIRTGTLQRSLLPSGGPHSGVVPSIGGLAAR